VRGCCSPIHVGCRTPLIQGCEADLSPPYSSKFKNGGAIPSFPNTPSWLEAWISTLLSYTWRSFTHLQPQDAPCRNTKVTDLFRVGIKFHCPLFLILSTKCPLCLWNIKSDSKLLSGFPLPIIFKPYVSRKACMLTLFSIYSKDSRINKNFWVIISYSTSSFNCCFRFGNYRPRKLRQ
jgi:hypothetical protein